MSDRHTPPADHLPEPDWSLALCASQVREGIRHPDDWHVDGALRKRNIEAKKVCGQCPIQLGCRMFAAKNKLGGIWGGKFQRYRDLPSAIIDVPVSPWPDGPHPRGDAA